MSMKSVLIAGVAALAAVSLAACHHNAAATPSASAETAAPAVEAPKTIVGVAASNPDFETLVAAVTAAGLVDTLNGAGPFTVFAPTDAAFAALPAGTLESLLLPENKAKLASILTYHVVPGAVASADLAGKSFSTATVNGANVAIDATGAGVKVNGAKVVAADVAASNGVIHVIDAVILPPAAH